MLGEVHRPDPPGLANGATQVLELLQRGAAGLVDHHVLARAHRPDRYFRPVLRDRGGADDIDRRVVEQPVAVDGLQVREALAEAVKHARIAGERTIARAFGARGDQFADEVVDVAMVEPDRGEAQRFRHAPATPETRTGLPVAPVSISASMRRWTRRASSPVTRGSRPVSNASMKSAMTLRW